MKKIFTLIFVQIFSLFICFAMEFSRLEHTRFSNGLELFIASNDKESEVYIEIDVKAGSAYQTAKNAGLFHLLEHMIFKANDLYPSAKEAENARISLGEYDGATSIDAIRYSFTLPADKVKEGLMYWNAALRTPFIDEEELEREKKVVIAEMNSYFTNSANCYYYETSKLFRETPYIFDALGSIENIKNATVSDLIELKERFYNPANTAIFIYGDVATPQIKYLVEDIFASWENARFGEVKPVKSETKIEKSEIAVLLDEKLSDRHSYVKINFRAPDAKFDLIDTYTAEYFVRLLNHEKIDFSKMVDKEFCFSRYEKDTAEISFELRASTSLFLFCLDLKTSRNLVKNANKFLKFLRKKAFPKLVSDKNYYMPNMRKEVSDPFSEEMCDNYYMSKTVLRNIAYFWALQDEYYLQDFALNMKKKANLDNMKLFLQKYFYESEPIIEIFVSPNVLEKYEAKWRKQGISIVKDNSFAWWKNFDFEEKISDDREKTERESYVIKESEKDYDYKGSKRNTLGKIDEASLSNGIKVYIQKNEDIEQAFLAFGIRGGLAKLKRGEEGLENVLFEVMSTSSKEWGKKARNSFYANHNSKVTYTSFEQGSYMQLSSDTSEDFFACLPIFTEGILYPRFSHRELRLRRKEAKEEIASLNANVQNALDEKMYSVVRQKTAFSFNLNQDSMKKINAKYLKSLYERILNAEDIFLVATGNIDTEKLIAELNTSIGMIKSQVERNAVFDTLQIDEGAAVKISHAQAQNVALAYRIFELNSRSAKERACLMLASKLYITALFNIVREKYGTCYTPTSFLGFDYGCDCFYALYPSAILELEEYRKEAVREAKSYKGLIEGCKKTLAMSFESAYFKSSREKCYCIVLDVARSKNARFTEELISEIEKANIDDVIASIDLFDKSPSRYFFASK